MNESESGRDEARIGPQVYPVLKIAKLHEHHPGLTPALGECFYEAICICLDRHHQSPVKFRVSNPADALHFIEFAKPDRRIRNAWANTIDATETGAYGICLAAVEATEKLVAIRRSETETGCDFYVAAPGTTSGDIEGWFRLEVSGLDEGSVSMIEARLRQKITQARKGRSKLPALVSVVGFKELVVRIERVRDFE